MSSVTAHWAPAPWRSSAVAVRSIDMRKVMGFIYRESSLPLFDLLHKVHLTPVTPHDISQIRPQAPCLDRPGHAPHAYISEKHVLVSPRAPAPLVIGDTLTANRSDISYKQATYAHLDSSTCCGIHQMGVNEC